MILEEMCDIEKLIIIFLILAVFIADIGISEANNSMLYPANGEAGAGNIITFDAYEQDNDAANGKEPIEWIILEKGSDGTLVLISKYALDCREYHSNCANVTWETCALRQWLNEDFYNTAFSAEERAKIQTVHLINEDNPFYGTKGSQDTFDRVWLLSINEVSDDFSTEALYAFFADGAPGRCAPTKYAVAQGAYTSVSYTVDGIDACWWWLRSPGCNPASAAGVSYDGDVCFDGYDVNFGSRGVRPAVRVLP